MPDHAQTEVEMISVINCGLPVGQEKDHWSVVEGSCETWDGAMGKAKMILLRYDAGDLRRDT